MEVLRVVREGVDPEAERSRLQEDVTDLIGDAQNVTYRVRRADDVSFGINRILEEDGPFDLVVIGASRESRLRNVLFGSIPDIVADEADCSVLMVHRHVPEHWTYRLSEGINA